ncbi:MAG: hypothetical protein EBU88_02675, partial [Acidobacteria bacterium]|nr:hypothetical protein [Acidobacteriota bacterium]
MIPMVIVFGYLAVVLYIGIFAFRRSRTDRPAEDFFLAGRSLGQVVFLLSLFGTNMTAFALLGSSGHAFANGIVTFGLMASSSALIIPLGMLLFGTRVWALGRRFGFITPVQMFRDRWECGHIGTVIFAGGSKTIITGGTGAGKRFYNVTFNATSGSAQSISTNDFEVANDLAVNTGNLIHTNQNILVGGNMVVSDLFTANGTGALNLNAGSGSKIFNPGATGSTYRIINVNAPTATYTITGNDLLVGGSQININSGRLNMGGRSITLSSGTVIVNTGGTFHIDAGAELYLANNAELRNSGGTLMILGSPTSSAFIRRNGTAGGFIINQNSGTLQARYYVIEN